MRILITGGAGCLGSNLIEHWLPAGHSILVIDNFSTGKREVVPLVPRLDVVEGSIADQRLIVNCFGRFKPEVVIHAAASYKDPANWHEDAQTNVVGSIHVAKAANEYAVGRLINFQTALCYGKPSEVPIPITHPTAPFTSYGITKTAGEHFMLMSGVPTTRCDWQTSQGPGWQSAPSQPFTSASRRAKNVFAQTPGATFLT